MSKFTDYLSNLKSGILSVLPSQTVRLLTELLFQMTMRIHCCCK